MQGDVGVRSSQPGETGNCNSRERRQGLSAEAGEPKIEPNYIWPLLRNRPEHFPWIAHAVELPAADYFEAIQFRPPEGVLIAENRKRDAGYSAQFARNMKSVFVQSVTTRWKRGNQANFHCCPGPKRA